MWAVCTTKTYRSVDRSGDVYISNAKNRDLSLRASVGGAGGTLDRCRRRSDRPYDYSTVGQLQSYRHGNGMQTVDAKRGET